MRNLESLCFLYGIWGFGLWWIEVLHCGEMLFAAIFWDRDQAISRANISVRDVEIQFKKRHKVRLPQPPYLQHLDALEIWGLVVNITSFCELEYNTLKIVICKAPIPLTASARLCKPTWAKYSLQMDVIDSRKIEHGSLEGVFKASF